MSAEKRANAAAGAWPTWPAPGIPVRPESWRRPTRVEPAALGRNAAVVAGAFVVSRVLGLARDLILAAEFGTSREMDAYVAAFRVPDLLFLVVMAGSFGAAFIPVFAGFLGRSEEERAWRLASAVLTMSALAMLALGLLTLLFADPIVRYLVAPGLPPEYQALAARTMRILLLSPVFLGLGIAAKGILEGQNRFDLPALAPIVYNLAIIAGALTLAPEYGVAGVAVGVAAGAVGHFLVQVPGLVRSGMHFRPTLDLATPGLSEVGRLLLPRLIGQAAFQINFIVVTAFATGAGAGEASAFNWAWQLLMLPHGVLALSISTVIFPTMSRLYEQGRLDELRATLGRAFRPLLFLSLPAAIGLFFFRTAIVQTILQWGAFDADSTRLVAAPLAWFALGLVGYALAEVLTRAFYAMHDTVTPVAVGVATIILNIALGAALVGRYGAAGLAFGLSLTTVLEAAVLLVTLRGRLGNAGPGVARWLARVLAAGGAMGAVAWLMAPRLAAATTPGGAPRVVQIALFAFALALALAVYLFAAHLLRLPELKQGASPMRRQLAPVTRLVHRVARRRSGWRA